MISIEILKLSSFYVKSNKLLENIWFHRAIFLSVLLIKKLLRSFMHYTKFHKIIMAWKW